MAPEITEDPKIKRLPINLGTDLQVHIEGTEIRFKSTLVGVDPRQFVLIKLPLSDETLKLISRNPIVVRYLYKGAIFGFRTSYINSMPDPIRVAFLRYPAEFENHELRNEERFECFLLVRIKIKEAEKSAALLDISEDGIRIAVRDRRYTPSFLKRDDSVSVFIRFPESTREEEFSTQVKRISDEGGRVILGLVFSDLDLAKRAQITKYVSDLREFN